MSFVTAGVLTSSLVSEKVLDPISIIRTIRESRALPLDLGHAVCLDPRLRRRVAHLLETESGMYWQANQKGELRSGRLKQEAPPA